MTDTSALAQLLVLGTPYWILAIAALLTTGRYRGRNLNGKPPYFRNRFSGWGVALLILAVFVVVGSLGLSHFGDCSGGFIDEVSCRRWPDMLGRIIANVRFLVTVTTAAIGFPALGCYVLAELVTRHRRRKSR